MYAQERIASISAQLNALAAQVHQLQAQLWQMGTGPLPPLGPGPWGVPQAPTVPTQASRQSTRTGTSELTVATGLCLGCGLCARIAPGAFTLDGQTGKAKVTDQGGDPPGLIQMAIARCPAGAIRYAV